VAAGILDGQRLAANLAADLVASSRLMAEYERTPVPRRGGR
jgi:hypothetical protein